MDSQNKEINQVMTALMTLNRVMPKLNIDTRETIKRIRLLSIKDSLGSVLELLTGYCTDAMVTLPISEVIEFINTLTSDPAFIETDNESKKIIIEKLQGVQAQLYLFTGKFYMQNEFTYLPTKSDVIRDLIDNCISMGYYFGYDQKILSQKGI